MNLLSISCGSAGTLLNPADCNVQEDDALAIMPAEELDIASVPECTALPLDHSITARTQPIATQGQNLPKHVRAALYGRRILVVDDHQITLTDLDHSLSPHVGLVTTIANPLQVQAALSAAQKTGTPYDALVLDLRMPEQNGDVVLRDLAKTDLLIPTVIHSGSHAREIQTHLFPQIETARSQELQRRLEELAKLEEEFAAITTPDELRNWRERYVRLTDGVPLSFVSKGAWQLREDSEHPHIALFEALARVIITGEETNWPSFRNMVAHFKPALFEAGDMTEYVEFIAETVRHYARTIHEIRTACEKAYPQIVHINSWHHLLAFENEALSSEYSIEGLTEEREDLGASRRHNVPTLIGDLKYVVDYLNRHHDLTQILAGHPALLARLEHAADQFFNISRLVLMLRSSWKKINKVDIQGNIRQLCHRNKIGFTIITSQEDFEISEPMGLSHHLLQQPIINAIQWSRYEASPPHITLRRTPVSELDPASQRYFKDKHGLTDNQTVIEVMIADSGPGIPEENLAHIFDKDFTTRADSGGTGFGLNFFARHIGKCNGTFHVESEVGIGTNFHVYFLPA